MVKTRFEGTSKGITDESRVDDLPNLQERIKFIHKNYNQPALVEEFVHGTEFTVPVVGNGNPQAMPVIQVSIEGNVNLGDQFFTYAMVTDDALQYECPANINLLAYSLSCVKL